MSDGDRAMQLRADQLVLRECDDHGILRLTLNDPKTRNSLSEGMMDANFWLPHWQMRVTMTILPCDERSAARRSAGSA